MNRPNPFNLPWHRSGRIHTIPADIAKPPAAPPLDFTWPQNPAFVIPPVRVKLENRHQPGARPEWTLTLGQNGQGGHTLTMAEARAVAGALRELEERMTTKQ